ncbi:protein kinase domain-containing protein [Pseudodesulfovibrio portus]|uniref:Protein kinase domain-containing protein n=1 Tax=Pseudodesulfovibrio portus TaxID=231439 RepID=A0ABM8AVR1_9BACT|nr:protein kinase [Pseudodesulfovibrio portus]BDQ35484.1 hypothetical protein JCM14722_30260 [Pseudodesulfovibrio portus]
MENIALRESLPNPIVAGESIHGVLITGQIKRGRYNLHHLGRRRSRHYLLKQFYSLNTDAFLRWQNEARFIAIPPPDGFIWPVEEWRGGVISPFPDGTSLHEWLEKPQPLNDRIGMAAILARRISQLHISGIRHRNLSPTAVWLDGETLTLTDFGSAHCDWWDDFWKDSAYTATSPEYCSPESLQDSKCGQAHDIYALGLLLHLLLTGRSAFGTLKRFLRPTFPGSVLPDTLPRTEDTPASIRKLCTACLAPDPVDRPTAVEAESELEPFAAKGYPPRENIIPPPAATDRADNLKTMVFVKDDARAIPLFEEVLSIAQKCPAIFLFVGLIPNNLPSGHLERFKGNIFRRLGQGFMQCRTSGLTWSLRLLENIDHDKAQDAFIRLYQPDEVLQ